MNQEWMECGHFVEGRERLRTSGDYRFCFECKGWRELVREALKAAK